MQQIVEWLDTLGLGQYAEILEANGIDLSILPDLTDQDLEKLGVLVGHRRKMLRAIAERAQPVQAAVRPDPPDDTSRSAQRRHMTVMFCDLVGSTTLSSQLDPEDMGLVLRAFQDACAGAVVRYGGFVAKFLGDGVLVYFGYPRAHEGEAERAVRAGLEIVAAVRRLRTSAGVPLDVRIGVATGLVVVAEIVGRGATQEQTVVGDTPNLATRLQALAEPGMILVAPATRRLLGSLFVLSAFDAHRRTDIGEDIEAWAVEGMSTSETRFEAARLSNLTAFVGRESEVAILEEHRRLAWDGAGQVVLISGEPGIGKSRFVRQFSERLAPTAHKRLRYQCSPFHTASALYPFIEQMKRAAKLDPNEPIEVQLDKLEALVSLSRPADGHVVQLFASLLSVPPGGRYPPLGLSAAQQRRQTLAALLDQLEAMAVRTPILAILEDAHWADATSLEVLDLAIERIRRLPVLCLVTFRPEFDPPWAGLDNVHSLTLGRLDRRDIYAMIDFVAAARSFPPEVADQIVAKTDGVPLFVEELTKMVLESGLMVAEGDGFRLDGPLPALAIPATLQDSLMARLDRLEFVKDVAQVGAAIGREFSYALLKFVTGRKDTTLNAALDQLMAAQLIFRVGSAADVRYRFKHALVQDAAYESLLKSRRQVLHRRIAETLRDQFPAIAQAEPELVGHHFTQAGLAEKATEWWSMAAESALARSAYPEAISHYANAIALAEKVADAPDQRLSRLRLQIAYGQALIAAHSHGAQVTTAAFDRASELATTIESASERLRVYYGLWAGRHVRGEMPAARALADAFLADAERDPNSPEAGLAHRAVGSTRWTEGDFVGARVHLEQALALCDAGDQADLRARFGLDPRVAATMQLALTLWQLGEVVRARQLAADGLRSAHQSKHLPTLLYGYGWTCFFGAMCDDGAAILDSAEALVELSGEHHLSLWQYFGTFFLDWGRWRCGDRQCGRTRMRDAVRSFRNENLMLYLTFYPVLLSGVEADAGDIDLAWTTLDEAIVVAEQTGQAWFTSAAYLRRASLILLRSPADIAGAEGSFSRAIAIAERQQARIAGLQASLGLSRLYSGLGRSAVASEVLDAALAGFGANDGPIPDLQAARDLRNGLE